MIKIENLVYKEDAEAKCFASENFNFIYSKIDNTSCSWGKTKDETPEYNPISPETITIKVDSNFLFNRDLILKLISLDYKKSNINWIFGDIKNWDNNFKNLICIFAKTKKINIWLH